MFRTGAETEERDPLSWIDLKDSPSNKTRPGWCLAKYRRRIRDATTVRILQAASDRQDTLITQNTLNTRKVRIQQVEEHAKASETTDRQPGHSIVTRLTWVSCHIRVTFGWPLTSNLQNDKFHRPLEDGQEGVGFRKGAKKLNNIINA